MNRKLPLVSLPLQMKPVLEDIRTTDDNKALLAPNDTFLSTSIGGGTLFSHEDYKKVFDSGLLSKAVRSCYNQDTVRALDSVTGCRFKVDGELITVTGDSQRAVEVAVLRLQNIKEFALRKRTGVFNLIAASQLDWSQDSELLLQPARRIHDRRLDNPIQNELVEMTLLQSTIMTATASESLAASRSLSRLEHTQREPHVWKEFGSLENRPGSMDHLNLRAIDRAIESWNKNVAVGLEAPDPFTALACPAELAVQGPRTVTPPPHRRTVRRLRGDVLPPSRESTQPEPPNPFKVYLAPAIEPVAQFEESPETLKGGLISSRTVPITQHLPHHQQRIAQSCDTSDFELDPALAAPVAYAKHSPDKSLSLSETKANQDERSSRVMRKLRDLKALNTNHSPGVHQLEDDVANHLSFVLDTARYCHGARPYLKLQFGRVFLSVSDVDKVKQKWRKEPFKISDWAAAFPQGVSRGIRSAFYPEITNDIRELSTLLALRLPNNQPMFEKEPSQRAMSVRIHCFNQRAKIQTVLEVDNEGGLSITRPADLVGAINLHCVRRVWDARIAVLQDRFVELPSQDIVNGVLKQLWIGRLEGEAKLVVSIQFDGTEKPVDLCIESVTAHYRDSYRTTFAKDLTLHLTRSEEMRKFDYKTGFLFKEGDSLPSCECHLSSDVADILMKNEDVTIGEQAMWATGDIMKGGIASTMLDAAEKIVRRINDLGLRGKNYSFEREYIMGAPRTNVYKVAAQRKPEGTFERW